MKFKFGALVAVWRIQEFALAPTQLSNWEQVELPFLGGHKLIEILPGPVGVKWISINVACPARQKLIFYSTSVEKKSWEIFGWSRTSANQLLFRVFRRSPAAAVTIQLKDSRIIPYLCRMTSSSSVGWTVRYCVLSLFDGHLKFRS